MPRYDFSQPLRRINSWKWEAEGIIDGHEVLPMSVADMDFISPYEVTESLRALAEQGEFGYSIDPPDHREVFAEWQRRRHGWDLAVDDVVVTNGLLPSLVLMLDAISAPGDGVIIFTPVYQNFADTIRAAGRTPIECDLVVDDDNYWRLDLAAFRERCAQSGVRAVIVCNPHNPVGRAWSADELKAVADIAQTHNRVVFSDEIHGDFVFDQAFNPLLKVADDPRGLMTLSSGGKIFNIGGLFASYAMTADPSLKAAMQKGLQRLSWHPSRFTAWGSYSAYRHGYGYRDEVVDYIRRMETKMVDGLNAMPYPVKAVLPEATYLLWADFRDCGWSTDELHRFLIAEAGLGFNRGDSYGANGAGFARINCAVSETIIDEAIGRLTRAFDKRLG